LVTLRTGGSTHAAGQTHRSRNGVAEVQRHVEQSRPDHHQLLLLPTRPHRTRAQVDAAVKRLRPGFLFTAESAEGAEPRYNNTGDEPTCPPASRSSRSSCRKF